MSISIIPAIDFRDGRCVRLTQGRKDDTIIYDGDPIDDHHITPKHKGGTIARRTACF